MQLQTLDSVKGIYFNPDIPVIKNCHALNYLPIGLYTIASTVRKEEIRFYPDEGLKFMVSFNETTAMIACCFHWFGATLVNYVRLIGLIDILSKRGWQIESLKDEANKKTVKDHCVKYAKEVIPDIYKWRHKIAGHLAVTNPLNSDNLGTLQDSVMNPVAYIRPHYCVSAHNYSLGADESVIPRWSLTQTYDVLSTRYWPESKLQQFPDKST